MKISTLIWLKSFGGNTGRVYSSRIYAVEIDDIYGYENEASLLSKIHSAGYVAHNSDDHTESFSKAYNILKHRNPASVIQDDATGISYEVLGVTKHRNPVGAADDHFDVGSAVIGLTKKLGGYYLARTLPAHEMEVGSVVAALEKSRKVRSQNSSPDALVGTSTATHIYKVRKVILGNDTDGADIGSIVQAITKTSRYIYGFIAVGMDAVSVVEKLTKHRNPTAQIDEHADISSIVTALSKRAGKGFVSGRRSDEFASSSEALGIFKVHPFAYGATDTQMDASSTAADLRKVRRVIDGGFYGATEIGSIVRAISKKRWYVLAEFAAGLDSGSTALSIEKSRRTYDGLKAPTQLRAYYGDVKAPTELTATLIEELEP